jgi:hypothetical protein
MFDFTLGNVIGMFLMTAMIICGVFMLLATLLSDFCIDKEEKEDE